MNSICLLLLSALTAGAALNFITAPQLIKDSGSNWRVEFQVSENTDVEVAIVNKANSTIVRHLAAGVLGANPPAPLTANSLSQTLVWDGKDDFGKAVTIPAASLSVRVRAGMRARFDKVTGGSPYAFNANLGLYTDAAGHLFVYGVSGRHAERTLREFDGNGNYLRTVYPYPANLPANRVSGLGIWQYQNGTYSPQTVRVYGPAISTSSIAASFTSSLLSFADSGQLVVGDIMGNKMCVINTDGSTDGSGDLSIITTPTPLSAWPWRKAGPACASLSSNGKFIYLSGVYLASTNGGGTSSDFRLAPDTGFWKDGQVFKVNVNTGVATSFIELDSVPQLIGERASTIGPGYGGGGYHVYAAIHGTATDDSGHVFICDRMHNRIGVYDTNGVYLGGIDRKHPDLVGVDKRTGAVYVVTRIQTGYQSGHVRLFKFNTWRNSPVPACSVNIAQPTIGPGLIKPYFGVSASGAKAMIWIVHNTSGIRGYRDDGNVLTLVKNFNDMTAGTVTGFDRMDVDPRTETAFINDGWSGLYKVENWSNPLVRACSTSTGKQLRAGDLCVSFDGQLYIREDGSSWNGPITRWTLDHRHAPLNWANSGSNVLTTFIYGRYEGTGGFGDKGMGVAPDKRVGMMYMKQFSDYFVGEFADSGCTDSLQHVDTVVNPLGAGAGNYRDTWGAVRYDTKGNLYMGTHHPKLPRETPAGLDWSRDYFQGNVVRFKKGVKGYFDVNGVHGEDKVFTTPFSGFSGGGDYCACRSPRFDIDQYDRLFVPNAIGQKVSVIDYNGNLILRFGQYGNEDSKGPGSLVPTADVPFAFPVGAAASDNYIYVTDMVNTRLVRAKMDYVLDNMPGFSPGTGVADLVGVNNYSLQLATAPNPFNPVSRVAVYLPEHAHCGLSVFDANGRLVRELHLGDLPAGITSFTWEARQNNGRPVAAGIYFYRLTAGKRVVTIKTILTR